MLGDGGGMLRPMDFGEDDEPQLGHLAIIFLFGFVFVNRRFLYVQILWQYGLNNSIGGGDRTNR